MFVGHYGVSLAVKKQKQQIPLWLLFLAVQWVDILFCLFVIFGVEHLRIVPGFTAYNPYDLYDMPYTHSLLGSVVCSLVFGFGAAFILWKRAPYLNTAMWLTLAVFSHFLLDVPMHVKDMLLMPGSHTHLGCGLWNHFYLSMGAELVVLLAGLFWFGVKNRNYKFWTLIAVCLALLISTPFMPPPGDTTEFAFTGLSAYLLLAAFAWWAGEKSS
jgi:hypothetical protein